MVTKCECQWCCGLWDLSLWVKLLFTALSLLTLFRLCSGMWRCTWFHWTPAGPVRFTVVRRWSRSLRWVSTRAFVFLSLQTPWRCVRCSCLSALWDLRPRRSCWWVWGAEKLHRDNDVLISKHKPWHVLCVSVGNGPAEPGGVWRECRDGLPLAEGPGAEWGGVNSSWPEELQSAQTPREPGGWAKAQSFSEHRHTQVCSGNRIVLTMKEFLDQYAE